MFKLLQLLDVILPLIIDLTKYKTDFFIFENDLEKILNFLETTIEFIHIILTNINEFSIEDEQKNIQLICEV